MGQTFTAVRFTNPRGSPAALNWLVCDSPDPSHQKPAFSRIFPPSGANAGNFTACSDGGRTDLPELAKTCRFSPVGFHPGEPGKRRPSPSTNDRPGWNESDGSRPIHRNGWGTSNPLPTPLELFKWPRSGPVGFFSTLHQSP